MTSTILTTPEKQPSFTAAHACAPRKGVPTSTRHDHVREPTDEVRICLWNIAPSTPKKRPQFASTNAPERPTGRSVRGDLCTNGDAQRRLTEKLKEAGGEEHIRGIASFFAAFMGCVLIGASLGRKKEHFVVGSLQTMMVASLLTLPIALLCNYFPTASFACAQLMMVLVCALLTVCTCGVEWIGYL